MGSTELGIIDIGLTFYFAGTLLHWRFLFLLKTLGLEQLTIGETTLTVFFISLGLIPLELIDTRFDYSQLFYYRAVANILAGLWIRIICFNSTS